jgi:redox-sensing transcriptional repressor
MKDDKPLVIPKSALSRMPIYYCYLQERMQEGKKFVSSSAMAESLGLNGVQVRKDLAGVSSTPGRSKVGFPAQQLLEDMKRFLGYDSLEEAILVGAGGLGKTLLQYPGFKNYGLDIVAGFDTDESLWDRRFGGKPIYSVSKMESVVKSHEVRIGIITVPGPQAQGVADAMVACGIKAIWNFAPVHVDVGRGVVIKNENLAASLAVLAMKLD